MMADWISVIAKVNISRMSLIPDYNICFER